MKKKIIVLCAALAAAMAVTACGAKTGEQTNAPSGSAETDVPDNESNTEKEAAPEGQDNREVLERQYQGPKEGDTVAAIKVKGYGTIRVCFFPDQAPKAVENFITHAKEGYYDGVTFHRVINDFMIQGGDPTGTGAGGESIWGEEFENECTDELLVTRGSLCMANAGPDTNGSQFFITQARPETMSEQYFAQTSLSDAAKEIYMEKGGAPWLQNQHTVFGQVYEGMDVVDAIAAMDSDGQGTPAEKIVMKKVVVSQYQAE